MIHPKTRATLVNENVGLGVFATEFIPKGTIVYVIDSFDIVIKPNDKKLTDELYKDYLDKYSYVDEKGDYIICWDHGKYVNHCCNPNTLTTGYGFEIAIRDIQPGEEITDDYLLLNSLEEMTLNCKDASCRKMFNPSDFDDMCESWDNRIKNALKNISTVDQPLWKLIDQPTMNKLNHYLKTGTDYQSVRGVKFSVA